MDTLYQLLAFVLAFMAWNLIGQGALHLVLQATTGRDPRTVLVYRAMAAVSSPAIWVTRRVIPRRVGNQHMGWLTIVLIQICYLAIRSWFHYNGWIGTPPP